MEFKLTKFQKAFKKDGTFVLDNKDFFYKLSLSSKQKIKKLKVTSGVDIIDNFAFSNCPNLESVEFDDSVKIIRKFAFKNCEKLTNFNIPKNLKSIGLGAFRNTNVKDVEINTNVFVNTFAFENDDLNNVVLDNCRLQTYSFRSCSIKNVVLGRGINQNTNDDNDILDDVDYSSITAVFDNAVIDKVSIPADVDYSKLFNNCTIDVLEIDCSNLSDVTMFKVNNELLSEIKLGGIVLKDINAKLTDVIINSNELLKQNFAVSKLNKNKPEISNDNKVETVDIADNNAKFSENFEK